MNFFCINIVNILLLSLELICIINNYIMQKSSHYHWKFLSNKKWWWWWWWKWAIDWFNYNLHIFIISNGKSALWIFFYTLWKSHQNKLFFFVATYNKCVCVLHTKTLHLFCCSSIDWLTHQIGYRDNIERWT